MTVASLLKLSQELRIGIDEARCSDIIRMASSSSSSTSSSTISLADFASLFCVQLVGSNNENSPDSASQEEARRLLRSVMIFSLQYVH
jgi:hypothetical protein